jgi:hypothetical protein
LARTSTSSSILEGGGGDFIHHFNGRITQHAAQTGAYALNSLQKDVLFLRWLLRGGEAAALVREEARVTHSIIGWARRFTPSATSFTYID